MKAGTAAFVGGCVLIGVASSVAFATQEDAREVEGRALFSKAEYQKALDVFATLFAEKGDPIYLRNIGRCHQLLRQPVQAIDSFREYLRRAPHLRRAEREEVNGFIREMEELKAQDEAQKPPDDSTRAPPLPKTQDVGAGAERDDAHLPPAAPPPAEHSDATVAALDTPSPHDAPADETAGPITHRWWFWTGIGAVVVGAAVAAVVLTAGKGSSRPGCPSGFMCP